MSEHKCCPTCGQKIREVKPLALTDEARFNACKAVFEETKLSRIPATALIPMALNKCQFDVTDYNRESAAMQKFIRESGFFVSHIGKGGGVELVK